MRQVKEDRPFRGPNNFKSGDFEYIDESTGDVHKFVGVERILFSFRVNTPQLAAEGGNGSMRV